MCGTRSCLRWAACGQRWDEAEIMTAKKYWPFPSYMGGCCSASLNIRRKNYVFHHGILRAGTPITRHSDKEFFPYQVPGAGRQPDHRHWDGLSGVPPSCHHGSLTPEGMQPFSLDGSYVVCNGEIYGLSDSQPAPEGIRLCQRRSDCEVLCLCTGSMESRCSGCWMLSLPASSLTR